MDPAQRVDVVRVIAHALDLALDPAVDRVNAPRRDQRVIELAEHHGEHVPERALKPSDDIGARARVLIDRVRDHRMRELQERRATAAEEQPEIPAELPRDRSRTEDAFARVGDDCAEIGQGRFELRTADDLHGPIVDPRPRVVKPPCASVTSRDAATRGTVKCLSSVSFSRHNRCTALGVDDDHGQHRRRGAAGTDRGP